MCNTSLTKDTVRDVAEGLISAHDSTTNLDIKNELRKMGYKVTQKEISSFMDNIATEEDYEVEFNGQFRKFSFTDASASALSSSQSNVPYPHLMGNVSKTVVPAAVPSAYAPSITRSKIKSKEIEEIKKPSKGDWEVNEVGNISNKKYFPGNYKRYLVRYRFHSLTGVHYHNTRSRRVI